MFSLVVAFPTLFRIPLSLHFDAIFGGAGATILPLGCLWDPLEPLLELSWAAVGLTGPSLGAFWDALRSFGLLDAVKWLKCVVWSTWVPPGSHFSASEGSFALARLPLGFAGPPLTPLWVSPGALWVLSALFLCYLGWGALCDPYMPVQVL